MTKNVFNSFLTCYPPDLANGDLDDFTIGAHLTNRRHID